MDDWVIAVMPCGACETGFWPGFGPCPFCEGACELEYEGPDEPRVSTPA